MNNCSYPAPVDKAMRTVADIFRHQGRKEFVELIENAHARFDEIGYDDWNGGTTSWALRLEVPVSIYAALESQLNDIENEVLAKLQFLVKQHEYDPIQKVSITPILSGTNVLGQRFSPSEIEVHRIWPDGGFRLFVSHLAKHKIEVSALKNELKIFGIAAFVAHEAIQPSLEWQREIELALRSMHGLLALITDEFHASSWTDQEIGWAFGRGILVLPVRLGTDPYGFAGKVQAISGILENSRKLAKDVFDTLIANSQTHGEARRALVKSFCESNSYKQSIQLSQLIRVISDFTDDEKDAMRNACMSNSQLANAHGVPNLVYDLFGMPVKKTDSAPQPVDDSYF